jgi:two-component system response regulator YesN
MQVLIVDDDRATVDVIYDRVNWDKLGINQVYTAYQIKSAKEIVSAHQIDIVISDIEMPQGSGLELLEWFRENQFEGEFLLLTCHENFDYAMHAVKLHAAEYLLKPLDVSVMEQAIKKIVLKVQEGRLLRENSEYGKWAKKNESQLLMSFWNMALTGEITPSEQELNIDINQEVCLVVSRITDMEKDKEKFNPNLLVFILKNIHSEKLCGSPESNSVVCFVYETYYVLASICHKDRELERKCRELIQDFRDIFQMTITCCMGNSCKISDLSDKFRSLNKIMDTNVAYYGSCYTEDKGKAVGKHQLSPVLDPEQMESYLKQKKKVDFLNCLKVKLNDKICQNTLDEQMLKQVEQEVWQVVYTYLIQRGIQIPGLFMDDALKEMEPKASQSVTDMIRWVNFLIDRVFGYEEEVLSKYTMVDKINKFVKEHYRENIGRNEIAAYLYLTPEYLSKLYKKQTGKNLKDYIIDYRIEQAKLLLQRGGRSSEVAQAVGFENFTYFSTLFKKMTGVSPNQYRKK